jgi:adenylosuccinate synthase
MSTVVIGSQFGDEGKGLIADFEVRRTCANTVVRFNGGAQAGHTVVSDNTRHVFGNFASGTLAGAVTYLGPNVIVNFDTLIKEYDELKGKGFNPKIDFSPACSVSTVYDVALNAIAEISRGTSKHGSCGLGINETVTRCLDKYPLTMSMFFHDYGEDIVLSYMRSIQKEYVPKRLAQILHGKFSSSSMKEHLDALKIEPEVVVDKMFEAFAIIRDRSNFQPNTKCVFEGAQGLMLDEYLGFFPYVTRSMTGLPYAIVAAKELNVKELNPVYVTRCYTTRHGAGPMGNEEFPIGLNFVDETNKPNPWQDSIRVGTFCLNDFNYFVNEDFKRSIQVGRALGIKIERPTIAITCLDQFEDKIPFKWTKHHKTEYIKKEDFISMIAGQSGFNVSHLSYGPSAKDVKYVA